MPLVQPISSQHSVMHPLGPDASGSRVAASRADGKKVVNPKSKREAFTWRQKEGSRVV